MTVTQAVSRSAPGPSVPAEVLLMCYRHRLLTTRQIHLLHRPDGARRSAQRVMRGLRAAGLANFVRSTVTDEAVWYLTDEGAVIAESGMKGRSCRYRVTAALAKGPLREHTLAVNEVGLAFVTAARTRGDECSPGDWEHEVAFKVTDRRTRDRQGADACIADAVLHYTRCRAAGQELLARFVEVDRGTETVARLADKLRSYVKLHGFKPKKQAGPVPGGWRGQFLAFPKILVVLCDRPAPALASRRDTLLKLCAIDPVMKRAACSGPDKDPVVVMVTTLPELVEHGPFAPIFWTPGADQPVDVVGDHLL
jgi:Replication-relaxation